MGQAAGVKRRKARAGNFRLLNKRKAGRVKKLKHQTKGLGASGLEDVSGATGRCLLTRLNKHGLVSNLKKQSKPDPRMMIKELTEKYSVTNRKVAPSTQEDTCEDTTLAERMLIEKEKKEAEYEDKKSRYRNDSIPRPHILAYHHFLDNYGEDYRLMASDPKNYDQWTWKEIRTRIKKFKNSGAPFAEYLKDRGFLDQLESRVQNRDTQILRPNEKLEFKLKEMLNKEKVLKRKLTAKKMKNPGLQSDSESDSEDNESTEEAEVANEPLTVDELDAQNPITFKQKKKKTPKTKTQKRRSRQNKGKLAKKKRNLKAYRS